MSEPIEPKPVKNNYSGNSHKKKAEEVKVEEKIITKVTTSGVTQRKTPLGTRIKETIVGEDIHSVVDYVRDEVAIPAFKSLVEDLVNETLKRFFWGETARRVGTTFSQRGSRGYSQMSTSTTRGPGARPGPTGPAARNISDRGRELHDTQEIIIETYGEAQSVLEAMYTLLEDYGEVSMADFYKMVGLTGSFTDNKYGWTDLNGSEIKRIREGYVIRLPKTHVLD